MADDGSVGFLESVWRFFTFYKMRKSLGIARAADRQFTGSASGIADAFDIQQRKMIHEYNELRDAVAQVEAVAEDKRQELEKLNEEEELRIQDREGAEAFADEAEKAGNAAELEKHSAAFARFDGRINQIEARQATLEEEIKGLDGSMKRHLLRLTEMQADIQRMPLEKAEQIADFVSATKIIELNDRLMGLQDSMDTGPIDAVRKSNKELTAKARISDKLAGTDVRLQDAEYRQAGRVSTSSQKLKERLAARRAERDVKAGVTPAAPVTEKKAAETRQQI